MYRPPTDRPERPDANRRGLVGTLVVAAAVPLAVRTATTPAVVALAVVLLLSVLHLARAAPSRPAPDRQGRPRRAARRPEVVAVTADRRR